MLVRLFKLIIFGESLLYTTKVKIQCLITMFDTILSIKNEVATKVTTAICLAPLAPFLAVRSLRLLQFKKPQTGPGPLTWDTLECAS